MKKQYKLLPDYMGEPVSVILETTTMTWIPMSDNNPSYQQYLAWIAEGNEPLPADEPPTE